MLNIQREFFEETSVHVFTAEVSELQHGDQLNGRRALPAKFTIPKVGNGNPFMVRKISRSNDGDLEFVEYIQSLGCVKVIIFND